VVAFLWLQPCRAALSCGERFFDRNSPQFGAKAFGKDNCTGAEAAGTGEWLIFFPVVALRSPRSLREKSPSFGGAVLALFRLQIFKEHRA
jgi:hypothetical protein